MVCRFSACYEELPICKHCLSVVQKILVTPCKSCGNSPSRCECSGESGHRFLYFYTGYQARRLTYLIKNNVDGRTMDFMAELAVSASGLKMDSFDGVTYVPRHPRRAKRYGYDQAKELAKSISRIYGVPVVHALKRVGGSEQKLLSKEARFKNIIGRYKLCDGFGEEIKYKKLLLVDDIYTTGATVKACKSLLVGKVASSVIPFTLAKTNYEGKSKTIK